MRRRRRARRHAEQGAGDQGLMFGYACNETPELMPAPIMFAHRLGRELTRIRKSGKAEWLRPDAKSQVSVIYENDKPVGISNVVISTQHAADVKHEKIEKFCIEKVIKKVLPEIDAQREDRIPDQPDRPLRGRRSAGRHRPDRPQDHRRQLRRHGPSRRRRVLGQGSDQGRSQRRLHGPLGREEHRRGRARDALRNPVRLRHRPSRSGQRARSTRSAPAPLRDEAIEHAVQPQFSASSRRTSSSSSICSARSTARPPTTATSAR